MNGIAGGNTAFGQICVVASNPCQAVKSFTSPQVDYLAPGAIPSPNPVSAAAASAADPTKSASAQITVINHVLVSVQPGSVTLAPLAVQSFAASVLGTSNQNVVWQVQGAACSTAGICGTVTPSGTYTAPSAPPAPNAIQVVAISSNDPSQSGIANVTISTGANILALHPSSVYAGAAQGFTLRVDGSGFAASSPGPGSAMLIGGTARITTCTSALECTAPVTAVDVAVVWTGVSGTTLVPAAAPLTRTSTQNACGPDGVNSVCFDQADTAFTPGVLAFTRVITTDRLGVQVGSSAVSTQLGQILDADIYFNPGDSNTAYATPQALAANPKAYDLESLLTHELGHFLGFSHSAVWSAIMFPFAPAPGTFSGTRPTTLQPDAPLGEDDRTGLRVLYPDPADVVHQGSISGRILPANPLALPASPPGVTGVFGTQVVAVDASSGAVGGRRSEGGVARRLVPRNLTALMRSMVCHSDAVTQFMRKR